MTEKKTEVIIAQTLLKPEKDDRSHHEKMMDHKYEVAEDVRNKLAAVADPDAKSSIRTHAIIRAAAVGWGTKDIAQFVGLTPNRVSKILSSQSAKQAIYAIQEQMFTKDPQKMFMEILPESFRTARKVMRDKKTTQAVKVDTAFRFMERALGKPVQQVEHSGNAIRELFTALDKLNRGESNVEKKDNIVDAEFKELKQEKKDSMDEWLDDNL